MKRTFLMLAMFISSVLYSKATEQLEITGTYQVLIACHDTHHIELAQLVVPGKDKFSGRRHTLLLSQEQQSKLRSGMKLKVKGQRKAVTTTYMTKAEVRRLMFNHMTKRAGIPPSCKDMGDIIQNLKTEQKGGQSPCGHDHGKLKLAAADDDDQRVEVTLPEYIEVSKIIVIEGGGQ